MAEQLRAPSQKRKRTRQPGRRHRRSAQQDRRTGCEPGSCAGAHALPCRRADPHRHSLRGGVGGSRGSAASLHTAAAAAAADWRFHIVVG